MIESGTHDPAVSARIAGEYPDLDMVTMPTGATMPRKLADRGDRGWLPDDDRSSDMAVKLRGLVDHMDSAVSAWLNDQAPAYSHDEGDLTAVLVDICETWRAIRAITQGRDIADTTREG